MYNVIVTIIAVLFVVLYFKVRFNNKALSLDTTRRLSEADTRYAILLRNHQKSEDGIVEIVESYENDMLDLKQNVETLGKTVLGQQESIDMRDDIIAHHASHCHSMGEIEFGRIMEQFEGEIECIMQKAKDALEEESETGQEKQA